MAIFLCYESHWPLQSLTGIAGISRQESAGRVTMKALRWAELALVICGGAVVDRAGAKDVAKADNFKNQILGMWSFTDENLKGSTIEFLKDGRVKVIIKQADSTINLRGSYEIEGGKLTITTLNPNNKKKMKRKSTIKSITAKEMILTGENGKDSKLVKK
jgi:uncharacterized protein (TIGR03066 family)